MKPIYVKPETHRLLRIKAAEEEANLRDTTDKVVKEGLKSLAAPKKKAKAGKGAA
jgi:hypothetical protein